MTKVCISCKINKPLSKFCNNKKSRDKHQAYCKVCAAQESHTYRQTARYKNNYLKRKANGYFRYGKQGFSALRKNAKARNIYFSLTAETLESWWLSQRDICQYCGRTARDFIVL